jgi:hypothetical protein
MPLSNSTGLSHPAEQFKDHEISAGDDGEHRRVVDRRDKRQRAQSLLRPLVWVPEKLNDYQILT